MDLIDIIAEKKFLGQEYLTWLWYKSDTGKALPIDGVEVVFEKHIQVESDGHETIERVTCQFETNADEAFHGLVAGKKLEQAKMLVVIGDSEWSMQFSGSLFEFKSVKTPKTVAGSETDDAAEKEGRLLDKIGLHQRLTKTMDDLFNRFLIIRTDGDLWKHELNQMRDWIHDE